MTKDKDDVCFACMECGKRFATLRAAEKAAFGPDGCPRCGGSDIDMSKPVTAKLVTATALSQSSPRKQNEVAP